VAAIYRRKDSQWFWLRYKTANGKWSAKATRYRTDNTLHRAKAQEEAAKLSVGERTIKSDHGWVSAMIESHPVCPSSKRHYLNSWRHLSRFIDEHGITLEEFSPIHADQYITWRIAHPRTNGKPVCRNMAVDDVKALKWIHRQGRLRGLVHSVAMIDYRAKKSPPSKRPVFTDDEITRVRKFICHSAEVDPGFEWMFISFEIGYTTGCRLRETRLDLRLVDLHAGTITFPEPKGGVTRAYTIPIPSTIVPLLSRLKASGRRYAFDWPGHGTKISHHWRVLFNLCGLFKHTFHSLRATRVTNLRKSGIPQSVAMRLVNHSSTLVHELYQRHFVEDLRKHVDAGLLPSTSQNQSERQFRGSWENHAQKPSASPSRMKSNTRPTAPAYLELG